MRYKRNSRPERTRHGRRARRERVERPDRYRLKFLSLAPLLVLLPIAIDMLGDFSGQSPQEAFHRCLSTLHSPFLWAATLFFAALIVLYLRPILKFYADCSARRACARSDAETVIHRFNMLHPFIIGLSVVGFMSSEIAMQFAENRMVLHSLANRFFFLNSLSKGLLAGVIISFNLENLLFASKKAALGTNPATTLAKTSLYSKVFVIMAAIMLFFLFQIFITSIDFFNLGADILAPGTGDAGAGADRFFGPTFDTPEIKSSMKVIALKTAFFFILIFQLIMQIKRMIRNPINSIRDRLALINAGDVGGITEVDILSNDEFTEALGEINALIRRQQEALSSSSERLVGIVERAADPIVSFDDDARILLFNPAAQAFFGYGADEAANLTLSALIECDCPDGGADGATAGNADSDNGTASDRAADVAAGRPAERELVRRFTDGSNGLTRFTGIRKTGERVPFESNVSSVRSGASVIHTAILRDISRQMETESHLTEAKVAAENANRLKTEFLANMSHELRTPLNAVLGFTQLLENDRNLTDAQREKLNIISRSGGHLLSLINDILDISKIEAGKFEIHESAFDLPAFVEDIREMFSLRCKNAGLGLYVEFAGAVPERVLGDIGKLRQVLINLVGNAVKFTKEGGIGITVGPDAGKIRFSVSDSGKGIPADELDIIMQPFRQSSLNDNEGGTGLGLAISSRYIQMMGGSLSVTSKVGEGSVFTFAIDLPETDAELPGSAEEPISIAVKKGKEVTALIVDDKELNRLVLKEMLGTAGFQSVEAENGKVAVERAREIGPDLVFMDIKMPVMDGYEAVRALKADPATAHIPVFALTASAFTNDEAKILASGFDGFLAKPFKKSSLFALIRDKSSIELEYETALIASGVGVPDPESVDWGRASRALGTDGIAELADTALINDFTAIRSIAARVEGAAPEFAALLAHYAGNYDEQAIDGIVKRLSAAAGPDGGRS